MENFLRKHFAVSYREDSFVAGAGFEPTTSGL